MNAAVFARNRLMSGTFLDLHQRAGQVDGELVLIGESLRGGVDIDHRHRPYGFRTP
jgi:hypothetical protein